MILEVVQLAKIDVNNQPMGYGITELTIWGLNISIFCILTFIDFS